MGKKLSKLLPLYCYSSHNSRQSNCFDTGQKGQAMENERGKLEISQPLMKKLLKLTI